MNALFTSTWLTSPRASAERATGAPAAIVDWVRHTVRNYPWSRRRMLRRFGWPGAVGVGLLVMCQAFYFSAIRPAQATLGVAQQSAISLQERLKHAAKNLGRAELTPAEQLAQFYRMFPDEKELLPWLGKVFAAAQRQGLMLDEGEYKVTRDRVGRLTRFQIVLPIKSEYPQIRKFLDELRAEMPIMALEQLQFERRKINDPVVDARVVLDLYLGQAS